MARRPCASRGKMATAKPTNPLPRRRRWRRIAFFAILALLALFAWMWATQRSDAVTAAAVGARVGCGCRFIAGRPLDSCTRDFEPGMGMVLLSEDAENKSVTARVPLMASQTARFIEGQGCVPERWEN